MISQEEVKVRVICNRAYHNITLKPNGRLVFHNHSKEDMKLEETVGIIGGEDCRCLAIRKAWINSKSQNLPEKLRIPSAVNKKFGRVIKIMRRLNRRRKTDRDGLMEIVKRNINTITSTDKEHSVSNERRRECLHDIINYELKNRGISTKPNYLKYSLRCSVISSDNQYIEISFGTDVSITYMSVYHAYDTNQKVRLNLPASEEDIYNFTIEACNLISASLIDKVITTTRETELFRLKKITKKINETKLADSIFSFMQYRTGVKDDICPNRFRIHLTSGTYLRLTPASAKLLAPKLKELSEYITKIEKASNEVYKRLGE